MLARFGWEVTPAEDDPPPTSAPLPLIRSRATDKLPFER
jgi:hypothetical protein